MEGKILLFKIFREESTLRTVQKSRNQGKRFKNQLKTCIPRGKGPDYYLVFRENNLDALPKFMKRTSDNLYERFIERTEVVSNISSILIYKSILAKFEFTQKRIVQRICRF